MPEKITFTGTEDFEALEKARNWCKANGYSYGELQADAPTGLLKGDYDISKWRNMDADEIARLDGTMNAPGRTYRSGPVTIRLKGDQK